MVFPEETQGYESCEEDTMSGVEYRMPAPLNLDNLDDLYPQWKRFLNSFKIFLSAAGLNRVAESRKAAIFLNCIGQSAQELYENTLKGSVDTEKLDEVIEIFEEHFKPKTNEIINTFHFNKRIQEEGENFDAFYTDLRKIAQNCNFDVFKDRMLRDKIIYGIRDVQIQQKLLMKKNLTLQEAVETCRTSELAKKQVKVIAGQGLPVTEVDGIGIQHRKSFPYSADQQQSKAKYKASSNSTYLCKKCNKRHGPRNCPAFGKTCSLCKKINHFAVGCKSKNSVHYIESNEEIENPEDL